MLGTHSRPPSTALVESIIYWTPGGIFEIIDTCMLGSVNLDLFLEPVTCREHLTYLRVAKLFLLLPTLLW